MASKEFKAEYRELHKGEYNIYLPDNKNPNSPLLIYLHGYYGEYNTPEFMEKELPEDLINNSLNSDFILACPLCPSYFFWRTHFVITFLDYLKDEYKLDQSKIFSRVIAWEDSELGLPHMSIPTNLLLLHQYLEVYRRLINIKQKG